MTLEELYTTLFSTIEQIVGEKPDEVPQLLTVILAGGPFRPFLEKQEWMNKVVDKARQLVADKKSQASEAPPTPQPMGNTPSTSTATGRAPARVLSVRDITPPGTPRI